MFAASALQALRLVIQSDDESYRACTRTAPAVQYQVASKLVRPVPDSIFYFIDSNQVNTLPLLVWKFKPSFALPDPTINALTTPSPMAFWHSKLGHASHARIHDYLCTLGIPAKGTFTTHDCTACGTHRTVARQKLPRHTAMSTRPLQILHADLSGISPKKDDDRLTPSLAGFRCFLLVKDDYTKYLWFYPLKEKSEAAEKIIHLIGLLKARFPNNPVERFFSDQGSEFTKNKLKHFFKGAHIDFDPTPTATPELNGRIEREMRSVKESGRALLQESQLPPSMWRHAFEHAAFLHNYLPHKHGDAHSSVCPHYDLYILRDTHDNLMSKMRTAAQTLRFFGTGGYLRNVRGTRNEQNYKPKGLEAVWCGVDTLGSTFKCFVPTTGQFTSEAEANFQPFKKELYCINRLLSIMIPLYDPKVDATQLDFVYRVWPRIFGQFQSRLAAQATQSLTVDSPLPETDPYSVAVAEADSLHLDPAVRVSAITDIRSVPSHPPIISKPRSSITTTVVGVPSSSREEGDRHVILNGAQEEQLDHDVLASIAAMDIITPVEEDPTTFAQAMSHPDATQWQQACDVEMGMIRERGVLELVDRPKGVKVMSSRWVLKRKYSDTGIPLKYKARLVVKGYEQRAGQDYGDTFAEVVSMDILLLILILAVQKDWHIEQIDVKSAFLYGDLEHEVYMHQPDGYQDGSSKVCLLKKSLYGLKQAPRQWNQKLTDILATINFKRVSDFQGLFVCPETKTYIVVYVDDMLIVSPDKEETLRAKARIQEVLEITSSDKVESYLSLHIERTSDGLTLDARKNVMKLLHDYRDLFSQHTFKKLPPILPSDAEKSIHISTLQERMLPMETELEEDSVLLSPLETSQYRSAVGSLNYLVSKCRPDIAFAASQLSSHLKDPNKLHWKMLMRLLQYLDRTREAKLIYRKQENPTLIGYSDATFGGDHVKHPHGGYFWYYGDCLLFWSSRRERRACVSIHEAELRCLINALEYGESMRNLLNILGEMPTGTKSVLYTDSQSSFNVMNNLKINKTSRRLSIHLDKIHDLMLFANIQVKHCAGIGNIADVLTKPLSEPSFWKIARKLMQFPDSDTQQGSVGENVST